MTHVAMPVLLDVVDRSGKSSDAGLAKRVQGRPARGDDEVGAQKIVEGMRAALRTLQNTKVSRKDVAGHAGVTPALVTYYFPERNSLVEAVTLPVVRALVHKVRDCIERDGPARQRLIEAIEVLLEGYAADAAVIALFSEHRASTPDTSLPDMLGDLDRVLERFFAAWLLDNPRSLYDAAFLRKAAMGACRSLARRQTDLSVRETLDDRGRQGFAEMVCSIVLGPVSGGTMGTPAFAGVGVPTS